VPQTAGIDPDVTASDALDVTAHQRENCRNAPTTKGRVRYPASPAQKRTVGFWPMVLKNSSLQIS
jgi:hypothetical protein